MAANIKLLILGESLSAEGSTGARPPIKPAFSQRHCHMRKISQEARRVSSERPPSQRRASLNLILTRLIAKINLSEINTLSTLDLPTLSFEDFIIPCLSDEPSSIPATMDSLYAFEEIKGVDTPPVYLTDEGNQIVADLDTKWELSVDLQQLIDQSLKEDVGGQSPSQLFPELLSSQGSLTSEKPADNSHNTADSLIDTADFNDSTAEADSTVDNTIDNTVDFCVNVSTDHQMSQFVGIKNENGQTILYLKVGFSK